LRLQPIATVLAFFFEVFVLENVRRSPDQPEANFVLARLAIGKMFAADHDNFVGLAVSTVMNNFVDARLWHLFTSAVSSGAWSTASVSPLDGPGLQLKDRLLDGRTVTTSRIETQGALAYR
jgi:chromosome condensin MukBEF complex kleisin-like MukF subunit